MPSDTVMLVGTLIPILAILMGGLVLLVPIAGLTLRFALKPALEALGELRELRQDREAVHLLEQRLSLVEERLNYLWLAETGEQRALPRGGAQLRRIEDDPQPG